jgi:CRISPR-associated protein Cas2
MFDLPTLTPADRKRYREFREFLLSDAFIMLQFSIYARHCASDENGQVHMERVRKMLPENGEIRMLSVTDKQYGRIHVYHGQLPRLSEAPPQQVGLF